MSRSQKSPNILLITSDQQHWNTLGCINPEIKTPNLDRLAKEGTLYTRAYCPNPTCTPTRASIITGNYPSQHGAYSLGTKLMENQHTVGEDFQDNGYATTLIGKAHFQMLKSTTEYSSLESYPIMQDLDFWRKFNGPFYGFQRVELARNHCDEAHVGQHYAIWMEEKGFTEWRDHFQTPPGQEPANEPQRYEWSLPEEMHMNAWIAERTNCLLEEYNQEDKPFFMWSSFFDPHPPYLVPAPWADMYDPEEVTLPKMYAGEHDLNPEHFGKTQQENPDFSNWEEPGGSAMHGCHSHVVDEKRMRKGIAVYYGMVSMMDKYIGKILDKLDELGMAENTLVVFTTDHGHFFGQHGLNAKGPFHYEDMIKIPFIVRQPGHVPADKRSDDLVSLVDLAPSFLSHCGITPPPSMTGLDMTKTFMGKENRMRDHILVENRHQPTTIHMRTYVDKRYKITVYRGRDYGEIFDLENDPSEINNLWNNPDYEQLKTELLLKMMHAELAKEPLPMPRIAGA